ncbi:uncharacterized protein LOC100555781 isoform X2 [Anolis carolinensis]|uniref:uncharacterized protein LOC100555781 isoform X2 n=1 Tax=Anolis carolinensis TaxID=28377 RepID=UPI0004624AA3|nr:PREDICTED: uncharacterized protein LOC100555781 isoform X2 [Anolis carolinensis]|eukprot:XP_016846598.1 PREDICTED: uncharacterized protein LOC100555781 isoform X2 [Anolis carolinensis]
MGGLFKSQGRKALGTCTFLAVALPLRARAWMSASKFGPAAEAGARASGFAMPRQRGERWNHQETVVFLSLFGELDVQKQLKACHRNQAIYEELADRMAEFGYNRSAAQLRTKAKDLKRQYRDIKKDSGQISQDDSFWHYYHFLEDICQDDNDAEPEPAASPVSGARKSKRHTEELKSLPQPAEQSLSDKTQEPELPYSSSRASQRLSEDSLGTSGSGSPATTALPRKRQRPASNATIHLAKIRARKGRSVTQFSKTFLRFSKNMDKFQQSFQNYMGFEMQEREKVQKEGSRTRKEIRSAASQMREAILVQAEAISKVADAINRYNDLLECFVSEPNSQRGGKDVFQDGEGASKQERNSLSRGSARRDSFSGSSPSFSSENSFDGIMG